MRQAIPQAEAAAPVVLLMTRLKKRSRRQRRALQTGPSRRMFGTLLSQMQEHREPIFIVAIAETHLLSSLMAAKVERLHE